VVVDDLGIIGVAVDETETTSGARTSTNACQGRNGRSAGVPGETESSEPGAESV